MTQALEVEFTEDDGGTAAVFGVAEEAGEGEGGKAGVCSLVEEPGQ